jgi:hypothetical protein
MFHKLAKSFLSEKDAIKCWLDTPAGYYQNTNNFGFDPHLILFKNSNDALYRLSRVFDKLVADLGWDIAVNIHSIDLATDDNNEDVRIVIVYSNDVIVSRNLKEVY